MLRQGQIRDIAAVWMATIASLMVAACGAITTSTVPRAGQAADDPIVYAVGIAGASTSALDASTGQILTTPVGCCGAVDNENALGAAAVGGHPAYISPDGSSVFLAGYETYAGLFPTSQLYIVHPTVDPGAAFLDSSIDPGTVEGVAFSPDSKDAYVLIERTSSGPDDPSSQWTIDLVQTATGNVADRLSTTLSSMGKHPVVSASGSVLWANGSAVSTATGAAVGDVACPGEGLQFIDQALSSSGETVDLLCRIDEGAAAKGNEQYHDEIVSFDTSTFTQIGTPIDLGTVDASAMYLVGSSPYVVLVGSNAGYVWTVDLTSGASSATSMTSDPGQVVPFGSCIAHKGTELAITAEDENPVSSHFHQGYILTLSLSDPLVPSVGTVPVGDVLADCALFVP